MIDFPNQTSDIETLADLAHEQPFVSDYSNLEKKILESRHGIKTIDGVDEFSKQLKDPTHRFTNDVIIRSPSGSELSLDYSLTTYAPPDLPLVKYTGSEYTPELNQYVKKSWFDWEVVESATLSQSAITDKIVTESHRADVVALVIIDGLSYWDWIRFGGEAQPVYVDCPTVTQCGYRNVVHAGEDGADIGHQLYDYGFEDRLAFTYWGKDNNELTNKLHDSFTSTDVVSDVEDFGDVLSYLNSENWRTHNATYIQITLTGPERVAHKMKEKPNLQAEVESVKKNLRNLKSVLSDQVPTAHVFGTADHGILWRMQASEDFEILEGGWSHNRRRHICNPKTDLALPEDHGLYQSWSDDTYFQLDYPYLFHSLRSNEPGTHGGFSFQESLVPLIRVH